jgi:hypothetical protein
VRIHPVPDFHPKRVVVFENAKMVADGHIYALIYTPGDDSCTDIFMHPSAVAAFEDRFPKATSRRLN